MSSVVHKIPPFLIISLFGGIFENFLNFIRLIFLLQIRSLIGGLIIATSIDYRVMLIRSSVGSSSWFFLRSLTRYSIFISYLFFYLGGVFFLLRIIRSYNGFRVFNNSLKYLILATTVLLLSIRGLPPFPIFFLKVKILFSFITNFNYIRGIFRVLLIFMILTIFIIFRYLRFSLIFLISNFEQSVEWLI